MLDGFYIKPYIKIIAIFSFIISVVLNIIDKYEYLATAGKFVFTIMQGLIIIVLIEGIILFGVSVVCGIISLFKCRY